jgi:hypothetical protein
VLSAVVSFISQLYWYFPTHLGLLKVFWTRLIKLMNWSIWQFINVGIAG